jgi:hypothetical protein
MPIPSDHPMLFKPIDQLSASAEFKMALTEAGFENLHQALEFDADTLRQKKGFNYHHITELIQILSSLGLKKLLKE